jgi:hypothetical protein
MYTRDIRPILGQPLFENPTAQKGCQLLAVSSQPDAREKILPCQNPESRIQNPESELPPSASTLRHVEAASVAPSTLNPQPFSVTSRLLPVKPLIQPFLAPRPRKMGSFPRTWSQPGVTQLLFFVTWNRVPPARSNIPKLRPPTGPSSPFNSPTHLLTYSPTPHEIQHFKTIRTQPVVPQHVTIHADQVMK